MQEQRKPRPKAILVGVQLPHMNTEDHEASLAELRRLVDTLGFEVVDVVSQRRDNLDAATVIGRGKLKEIAEWTPGSGVVPSSVPQHRKKRASEGEEDKEQEAEHQDASATDSDFVEISGISSEEGVMDTSDELDEDSSEVTPSHVDLVIFNCEVTPTQLRNLERAMSTEILDRNGVIIEIFHRHANTREARLQIEIAQLKYLAPRLRMSSGKGGDRQAGGIGGKGAGETRHELNRRRIRDRIAELQQQLEAIAKEDAQRRERRSDVLCVALIGYTNAGKSSLMRRLTHDTTYVADKLFATLGTTVRVMQPETKPRILLSDTVGFINELPHELVASFRSTLDEARFASLIFHVVDASDPHFRTQIDVSLSVLEDLETLELPRRLVLNKIDQIEEDTLQALREEFPDALMISAHDPDDIVRVRKEILAFFEQDMIERAMHIPYAHGKWVGELHKTFRVLQTEHDAEGTWLLVRGKEDALDALADSEGHAFLSDASHQEENPF